MIDLAFNNSTGDKRHEREFFEKIIKKSAKYLGLETKTIELSINLVGENKIKALNSKYRGKNAATDVLSFPLNHGVDSERGREGTQRASALYGVDKKSGLDGIMSLGDIFMCLPIAKKNAEEEGISLDFKLIFLSIHGFLHLLGYEHEKSERSKKEMFDLQSKILEIYHP